MNTTASSERLHIGFFGRSNVGKSSLMNAVTGQDMSVVSDTRGTTTDPVLKSMELLPLGPVVMFDTPGLDDDTELGALRMRKARQMLNKTDLAVMVIGCDQFTLRQARHAERRHLQSSDGETAMNETARQLITALEGGNRLQKNDFLQILTHADAEDVEYAKSHST